MASLNCVSLNVIFYIQTFYGVKEKSVIFYLFTLITVEFESRIRNSVLKMTMKEYNFPDQQK